MSYEFWTLGFLFSVGLSFDDFKDAKSGVSIAMLLCLFFAWPVLFGVWIDDTFNKKRAKTEVFYVKRE